MVLHHLLPELLDLGTGCLLLSQLAKLNLGQAATGRLGHKHFVLRGEIIRCSWVSHQRQWSGEQKEC